MGTNDFQLDDYNKIWVIGRQDFNYANFIPIKFKLIKKKVNLSWLDRIQFKYLTPIYTRRYAVFEFHKAERS